MRMNKDGNNREIRGIGEVRRGTVNKERRG